jgi:monothiol glutaredoxin
MAHPRVKEIETLTQSKPVTLCMKGTPEFPQCGFSSKAWKVLQAAGVKREQLAVFDVFSDDPLWDALEDFTKWPTVPQIFIGGKFVGGCDIVTEMYEKGELQDMLKEVGVGN